LLVYAPDAEVASALDRQVVDSPADGFHPARGCQFAVGGGNPGSDRRQARLGHQDERLVNLAAEVPPGFSRFASLIEVVGQGDEERLAGRQRARFYKDRGYEVNYSICGES
jgi:DNA polymerase-3 subunit chi